MNYVCKFSYRDGWGELCFSDAIVFSANIKSAIKLAKKKCIENGYTFLSIKSCINIWS